MNEHINISINLLNQIIDIAHMNKKYTIDDIGNEVYVIGAEKYTSLKKKYEIQNVQKDNILDLEDNTTGETFKIGSNRCILSNSSIDTVFNDFRTLPETFEISLKSIEFLDNKFIFRDKSFIKELYIDTNDILYSIISGNKECFLAYSINEKKNILFKSLENFEICYSDKNNKNNIKNFKLLSKNDPYKIIEINKMAFDRKYINNYKLAFFINKYINENDYENGNENLNEDGNEKEFAMLIKVKINSSTMKTYFIKKNSNFIDYRLYNPLKDGSLVKYIPSRSIKHKNLGVRHRTGTIIFNKENLSFKYTPEHNVKLNNNNSNNNNITNPNETPEIDILLENIEIIPKECNFNIDETLYTICHGVIDLDKESFVLPKNVKIITYSESGRLLENRSKKIPNILKGFKNKKQLIEKFRGRDNKYHVYCNKPGKRMMFHDHILQFSLKPIFDYQETNKHLIDIEKIIGKAKFDELIFKLNAKYRETKSEDITDYNEILMPEFLKHNIPIKDRIYILNFVLRKYYESFEYQGMIMKDDKPIINNREEPITNRNLNQLKRNESDFSSFDEVFDNFFIHSNKLIEIAKKNGKIKQYSELIIKIKRGISAKNNGTIYLKDFIQSIYDISNNEVNTFALYICRGFLGVNLNNSMPKRQTSGIEYVTKNNFYTNDENNNIPNFSNRTSIRLKYNRKHTYFSKKFKIFSNLIENPNKIFNRSNQEIIKKDKELIHILSQKNADQIKEYSRFRLSEIKKEIQELQNSISKNVRGGTIKNDRYFKLIKINNKDIDDIGRYKLSYKTKSGKINTQTPLNIASKVFTKIMKNNSKLNNCKITIQETTQNSNKKQYNYNCKRVKKSKDEISSSERIIIKNGKEIKIKNIYKNIIKYISK